MKGLARRRTAAVPECRVRRTLWAGLLRGDEVKVDGFQGLHQFLAAVFMPGSDEVDHVEVLIRGAVRAFPPERVKNRFGYALARSSSSG